MKYEDWLKRIISILKIRLSNHNIKTEELVNIIEYIYEDVLNQTNIIKTVHRFNFDECKDGSIDIITPVESNSILSIDPIGIYTDTKKPLKVSGEMFLCDVKDEYLNCKYIEVHYVVIPRIEKLPVPVLVKIQKAIVEGVVDQLRETTQHLKAGVELQTYNRYIIAIQEIKDNVDEYVWGDNYGRY